MRAQRGFTLIELVIVIAIIGILASLAVPKYIDMSTQAKIAKAKAGLGALRAVLATQYAMNATGGNLASYPTSVDADMFADNVVPCNPIAWLPCSDSLTGNGLVRPYTAAPTSTVEWQCHGGPQKDYWYVTDPLAGTPPGTDYGKAGACTQDPAIIDTSSW